MKILFAATGSIAVPTLEALYRAGLVKAVLTSPDEKGGRGNKIIEPPIKIKAKELGLPYYQMQSLRTEARECVKTLGCDTLVSFCYGKIFGPKFLSLFENKFNIHPSLLPKYRGCSPLYESIVNLDREGGISIQEIALEVDSGDILSSTSFPLDGTETLLSLEERVAVMAAQLASEVFSDVSSYHMRGQEGDVTYSRMLKKEDGEIDFSLSYPWPKAFTTYKGEKLLLCAVSGSAFSLEPNSSDPPGTVVGIDKKKGLKIAANGSYIYVTRLQSPSRKEMDAISFVNGDRALLSSILGR